ncbi:MAG TPA: NAD(P)/FAD-dependent oxidoreductase [Pyrinomonadaceae bacterium]|nr:NAD(P)/FAD-dependent oxidoreductase [Pyrinomonadaceae bacterium]
MAGNEFDIIVIGSGIGALTFASLMAQMKSKRVLVLERHFKLGGFTHTFSRPDDYTWDVGLHYVGQMDRGSLPRSLMDSATQGNVDWIKMPSPFDKFVYPDFTFEVPDDKDDYQRVLIDRFPEESDAIRRYFKDVTGINRWVIRRIISQCFPESVGRLLRYTLAPDSLKFCTTGDYLDRNFHNQKLKSILASQWAAYGLPPNQSAFAIHASIVAHYFGGAFYPVGGSGRLSATIIPIINAAGGQCLVNHRVREVIVRHGTAIGVKVDIKRGSNITQAEYFAPRIVSGAGAHTTYCHLIPASVNNPLRDEMKSMSKASSLVTLYLGLKESPTRLGFHGENHWIFAGNDHDALFHRRNELLHGNPIGCYLSFPSLKDPLSKTHTAEIIAAMDYDVFEQWQAQPWRRRDTEYQNVKARISDGLLDMVETHYPGFRELIAFSEVSTPITVEHFTGHKRGAVYGLPGTPDRFRLPWPTVRTPVKNLLLTGADVASPGIVGAMMGGVITAACVQGPFGFPRIILAARGRGSRR